ncbi:hypothetical protein [Flintibacter muris]|uniref:hypothetical protein n=1 Tax=Flintibacter muris TaxID=2941327 RepID=UPI002041D012|nr:hypothetical protein [Flintibacter muris]
MRKTTDEKGFAGAVVVTILVAGFMFLLTGAMLVGYFSGFTEPFTTGLILFCAFLYLAVAVGVIIALFQRWREIKGGEEDEAKKY